MFSENYIIQGKLITIDCNYNFIKESYLNFNENKNNLDD